MMPQVVLVVPPFDNSYPAAQNPDGDRLGVGYLLAGLRQHGITAEVIHCPLQNLSAEACAQEIARRSPVLVGITTLFAHTDLPGTAALAQAIKACLPGVHLSVGGHAATFASEALLARAPQIDSLALGEGEATLLELAQRVLARQDWAATAGLALRRNGSVAVNPPRPLIEPLDALPFPARDILYLLPASKGLTMLTSRGCPYRCSYCSVHTFYRLSPGRAWRGRSPEDVVDEIEQLKRQWGARFIEFNDDNFIGPGRKGQARAYDIGKELIRRKIEMELAMECRSDGVDEALFAFLKRVGLSTVCLGIESGVQSTLDYYRKDTTLDVHRRALEILNRLGFHVRIGFIGFHPLTTLADLKENIRFYQETGLTHNLVALSVFFNHLKVFGGAPIEADLRRRGVLEEDEDPFGLNRTYRFVDPCVRVLAQVSRQVSERPGRRFVMGDGFRDLQRTTMETIRRATGLDETGQCQVMMAHGLLTPAVADQWRAASLCQAFHTFVDMVEALEGAEEKVMADEAAMSEHLQDVMQRALEEVDTQILGMPFSQMVVRMKALNASRRLMFEFQGQPYDVALLHLPPQSA